MSAAQLSARSLEATQVEELRLIEAKRLALSNWRISLLVFGLVLLLTLLAPTLFTELPSLVALLGLLVYYAFYAKTKNQLADHRERQATAKAADHDGEGA